MTPIFKKALSRRTLLRGAGATVALPFLDAMVPAFASTAGSARPRRMSFVSRLPTRSTVSPPGAVSPLSAPSPNCIA